MHSLLNQQFNIFNSPQNIPVLAEVIPSAFISTAEASGDTKETSAPKSFKIHKSRELWKAEIKAREKYKMWMNENKPRDPQNKYFIAKNEAKKELRHIKCFQSLSIALKIVLGVKRLF